MKEERIYFVYKHTNLINGKIYIGITSKEPELRWIKGRGYKKQPFYNAIKYYGWDNFKHEILFQNLTETEAMFLEIELISFYKSYMCKFGYNADKGGKYAGKHSEQTKRKISEHVKRRKIICLETKEIFDSGTEASKKLGVDYSTLMRVCKGNKRNKSVKGLHFVFLEDYNEDMQYDNSVGHGKKIFCLELDKVFDSITQASKELSLEVSSIAKVCRGKYYSTGGYTFRYLDECR